LWELFASVAFRKQGQHRLWVELEVTICDLKIANYCSQGTFGCEAAGQTRNGECVKCDDGEWLMETAGLPDAGNRAD